MKIYTDFLNNLKYPISGTVEGPIGTSNKTLCLQQLYMDFITEEGLTWHITDEKTRVRLVNGRGVC